MIYSSIDIGSNEIKFIVMEYNDNKFNVLASYSVKSFGIKRGIITDPNLLVKSINEGNRNIEKQIGFKLDKAIITLPCYDTDTNLYETETESSGIISGADISNVLKKIIKENLDSDREVVNISPIYFNIDNEDKIIDPKGMQGYKLGLKALISTMPKELVLSYINVLKEASIDVIDICYNVIGDYYVSKKEEYNDTAGAVINIGHSKIEIGIFNKGLLITPLLLTLPNTKHL